MINLCKFGQNPSFIKKIECRQEATPTPTGSALKAICHPAMVGDIMTTQVSIARSSSNQLSCVKGNAKQRKLVTCRCMIEPETGCQQLMQSITNVISNTDIIYLVDCLCWYLHHKYLLHNLQNIP